MVSHSNMSNEETYFFMILKHTLQNYQKIMMTYFLVIGNSQ